MAWYKSLMAMLLAASAPVLAADSVFHDRAISLMKESPLVDTHIDLPQILRSLSTHVHHQVMENHG